MVIKYLALRVVDATEEKVSQEWGVVHAKRDSKAWRDYFELKQRERGEVAGHDGEIPTDMEGRYFL